MSGGRRSRGSSRSTSESRIRAFALSAFSPRAKCGAGARQMWVVAGFEIRALTHLAAAIAGRTLLVDDHPPRTRGLATDPDGAEDPLRDPRPDPGGTGTRPGSLPSPTSPVRVLPCLGRRSTSQPTLPEQGHGDEGQAECRHLDEGGQARQGALGAPPEGQVAEGWGVPLVRPVQEGVVNELESPLV